MRIGAYQFAISGDVNENYKEIEKAIYLAKHKDVQLLIFPECSLTGLHIAKLNGRICGAKRSHSVFEQPNCYQSV